MDENVVNGTTSSDTSTPEEEVTPVDFPVLEGAYRGVGQGNLEKLLNVPLTVTIELGRRRMSIKEVLELSPGAIIELDKIAGDPVDLLVNDRPFATGEVVAVKGYYGIRIIDIESQEERFSNLI